ncbi:O2AG1 protein, partial [Polypterus senegalus]
MNDTATPLLEFVLHCAIDAQQKRYTTPILTMIYLVTLNWKLLGNFRYTDESPFAKPMYICIATLAVIDLLNSTNLIPKIVAVLLDSVAVPYGACVLQMILVLYLEGAESLLLALMAYDRFVAIVHPLRYPSLVTNKTVKNTIIFLHAVMVIFVLPYITYFMEFSFCRSNVLNYCFCDYITMVKIACNEDPKYLIVLPITSIIIINQGMSWEKFVHVLSQWEDGIAGCLQIVFIGTFRKQKMLAERCERI